MPNPTAKTERDGVPLTIYDQPSGVTITSGSYGGFIDHGLSLFLHPEMVGEVPKEAIKEDLLVAFEEAYERVEKEVEEHNAQ